MFVREAFKALSALILAVCAEKLLKDPVPPATVLPLTVPPLIVDPFTFPAAWTLANAALRVLFVTCCNCNAEVAAVAVGTVAVPVMSSVGEVRELAVMLPLLSSE